MLLWPPVSVQGVPHNVTAVDMTKVAQTAKVAQSGPKWPKVAQSGPKWPKVTQSGPDPQRELGWPKVAQSGPKFRPPIIALKILKVHFFWDTLYKLGPNDICTSKLHANTQYKLGSIQGQQKCFVKLMGGLGIIF